MKLLWLIVFPTILSLNGCASRVTRPVSMLGDDLPFHMDPQDEDVMIYSNPNIKVTSYSKFIIEPVKIFSNDSFELKPEEEAVLAETFRLELINTLQDGYQIVDKPGPGVLRIRIGVQDIKPAEVDYVEEGAVVLRYETLLAQVAMELDCLDSVSGERVAALIHTLYDTRYFEGKKKTRLLNIRDAFGMWTKSLRRTAGRGLI